MRLKRNVRTTHLSVLKLLRRSALPIDATLPLLFSFSGTVVSFSLLTCFFYWLLHYLLLLLSTWHTCPNPAAMAATSSYKFLGSQSACSESQKRSHDCMSRATNHMFCMLRSKQGSTIDAYSCAVGVVCVDKVDSATQRCVP